MGLVFLERGGKSFQKNIGSTESKTGQGSGTLVEASERAEIKGLAYFKRSGVVPAMGAWAFLEEGDHSSPERGRSLHSDN